MLFLVPFGLTHYGVGLVQTKIYFQTPNDSKVTKFIFNGIDYIPALGSDHFRGRFPLGHVQGTGY